MTNEYIHKKMVPRLQAVVWTVALYLGAVALLGVKEILLVKLFAIFIVFLVLLAECSITFLDLKSLYGKKNFKGEIFGINIRLFLIIPSAFVAGVGYYISSVYNLFCSELVFYFTIFLMGWFKLEIAGFANNIESFLVDTKPVINPNPINEP